MHHESVPAVRRFIFFCLFCVLVFLFAASTTAPKAATSEVAAAPRIIAPPANLTTQAWGIFDPQTGEILTGKNVETAYPIASVTKLFTAYVAEESDREEENFLITQADVATEGKAGRLQYGDETSLYKLLYPLLLESSNDAAEAIRRFLGDTYTTALTATLLSLDLEHTKLHDASGLSPLNVSTVVDLAHFYAQLKNTMPHVLDITQLHSYVGETGSYTNNNLGREFSNFTGGKHGYTPEAEHTFIGTFTLPNSEEEVGMVILESKDLRNDIQSLLLYSESLEDTSDIMGE